MASIDASVDVATAGVANSALNRVFVVQRNISVDVDNYKGPTGVSNAGYMINAVGAGDLVTIFNVPSGLKMLDIACEVLTVGTGNIEIGDEDDDDRYLTSAAITSTGYITMTATTRQFSDDDVIIIKYESANDGTTANQTPELKITATFADYRNRAPATTFTP